jgi:hypothetical protein
MLLFPVEPRCLNNEPGECNELGEWRALFVSLRDQLRAFDERMWQNSSMKSSSAP